MAFSNKRHAQNAVGTLAPAGALPYARGNYVEDAALARAGGYKLVPLFDENAIVGLNNNLSPCALAFDTGNKSSVTWRVEGGGIFSNGVPFPKRRILSHLTQDYVSQPLVALPVVTGMSMFLLICRRIPVTAWYCGYLYKLQERAKPPDPDPSEYFASRIAENHYQQKRR